jgi:hypothetical protein
MCSSSSSCPSGAVRQALMQSGLGPGPQTFLRLRGPRQLQVKHNLTAQPWPWALSLTCENHNLATWQHKGVDSLTVDHNHL